MSKYKMIDLFAGIGGIRLGFYKVFKENAKRLILSESWQDFLFTKIL